MPLVDHLCVGHLVGLPKGPALNKMRGKATLIGRRYLEDKNASLFLQEGAPFSDGRRSFDLWAMIEQSRDGRSIMSFRRSSGSRPAQVFIEAQGSRADEDNIANVYSLACHALEDVLTEAAGVELRKPTERIDDFPTVAAALQITKEEPLQMAGYRLDLGQVDHEACSTPLGNSIVDENLECAAIPGVFVVGPGAFPRMGAANPALTIMAISAWVANAIAS